MSDTDFEARLARGLDAYSHAGVRPIDRYAIAEATIATARTAKRRWSWARPRAAISPMLVALLILAAAAGVAVVGSRLLEQRPSVVLEPPAVVAPSPSSPPVVAASPSPSPVVAPLPSDRAALPVSGAPCAAILHILQTWQLDQPQAPIPASGGTSRGTRNGDLLVTGLNDRGEVWVDRVDPSTTPPTLVRPDEAKDPLPYAPGFPLAAVGRIVASPDGRAVAVEEGDLGVAGCGEPLVLLSAGGIRRPFPVGAFQTVTDLAWAADGSSLYGVRRPTLDAAGQPFPISDMTREVGDGPGTLLRWDTGTGEATDLGTPCGTCGPLFVSPDGSRIATSDGDRVVVRDPDGTWRTVGTGAILMGWADDTALVVHGARVALDGAVLNTWENPCCHGTGYGGLLSPDGSTIAGMTMGPDMTSWRVTLVDVRTGVPTDVWSAPEVRGCTAFSVGSQGRSDCDASSSLAPGATHDSAIAISGYSHVVAWAPDGSAVVVLDQQPDSTEASVRVVPIDGSGAVQPVTIKVPDLTATLGFPNIGPSVAWMPEATP